MRSGHHLLSGARIVIIDQEILSGSAPVLQFALGRYQVTLLFFTTALLHQYAFIIGAACQS